MNEEFNQPRVFIDETMKSDLLCSAKWAKFLLVVGAIAMSLYFVVGLVVTIAPKVLPPSPMLGSGVIVGPVYMACALITVYPLVKGFQFANGVKKACMTGDEAHLSRGFAGLRAYLKYSGILTIIGLVILAVVLVAAIVLGCTTDCCTAA
ncbi:MAG: hypothetical protein IJ219_04580 [Bacteroidaceae bacterium]|nr:hypothetical protein [Bacteroidaceae bacterium]MBQ9169563.1 hypothetical protein [Bacteroidaceae bacterium]MBQ9294187.1 hypothetical protein [Bacteroidaceae bacterium]